MCVGDGNRLIGVETGRNGTERHTERHTEQAAQHRAQRQVHGLWRCVGNGLSVAFVPYVSAADTRRNGGQHTVKRQHFARVNRRSRPTSDGTAVGGGAARNTVADRELQCTHTEEPRRAGMTKHPLFLSLTISRANGSVERNGTQRNAPTAWHGVSVRSGVEYGKRKR